MAVGTVYKNQHTILAGLSKQYTTVVNLGTVWYDRWKEWLSEHADHIKTLGKFISSHSPQKERKKAKKKKHPFKLNLSVNHCQWKTAVSDWGTQCQGFFFFLFAVKKSQYVWWWGPEEHASFLCVWRTGSIHDFLLGTLPEPATVTKSNRI